MSDVPFDRELAGEGVEPHPQAPGRAASPTAQDRLETLLGDAEYLLHYAAEAGIPVDPELSQRIISAGRLGPAALDAPEAGALVSSISKLAAQLHPVTAESLRACREDSDDAIGSYKRIALLLAGIIIPLSMVSFIYTAISNTITTDLKTANELTVALHSQLDPLDDKRQVPQSSLAALQQFAATMRASYAHARQLNWFAFGLINDPYGGYYETMQLPHDLKGNAAVVQQEVNEKTKIYQEVRLFATNVQDATSVLWGAVGACILPVLYALLGACAYLLRSFSDQVERRTFALSDATTARFIIAAIGGMVVGLFSNFSVGQSASLSPLAIAFLAGYAVDIFFSFLEGSLQNLRSGPGQSPARRGS